MNSKDVPQDSASVRNIATFIGELAECAPQQVLANVSLLLVHLDSEACVPFRYYLFITHSSRSLSSPTRCAMV